MAWGPSDKTPLMIVIAGSWQEMADVLDMLQDISIPSEDVQLGRPASSMSCHASPCEQKPRCASAHSPNSPSKAGGKQPRCSSAFTSRPQAGRQQEVSSLSLQQQLWSGPLSLSGSSRSRTPLKGKLKGSPLSASAKRRHDWQS